MKNTSTLRDHLSYLTHTQAIKLLGSRGKQLLQDGGQYEINIDQHIDLTTDCFILFLEDADVTLTLSGKSIESKCSQCRIRCEHIAAAFSLILEEKSLLGLAKPPPEPQPVESLTEEALVEQELAERQERAQREKMRLVSSDANTIWSEYMITSAGSGKSYKIALRGWERGDSYCSCPDFRKNTLGTCKHILHALDKVKKRFPKKAHKQRYRQREIAVHLLYGKTLELRLLTPPTLSVDIEKQIKPISNRAINDIHDLLQRIQKVERQGHNVLIYPDAEEYIQQRLFYNHIESTVKAIRANPEQHPLRTALLKAELLPYQLDGIAFAVGAGRAILADDMGLGKTIQGIGVAELFACEVNINKVLVVTPASLKSQWKNEIYRFSGRSCQVVLGNAQERVEQYGDAFFSICNYEQVLRDAPVIQQIKWDLIILDEGQRIKNLTTKTSQVIKSLKSRFALVLSGTPLENKLDDLYSVVEFIDDRRLGPQFHFHNRHRVVDEKGKVLGYKDLSTLRKQLQPVLLRRTRDSVMQQLPPRTTEVIRITPTEEQLDIHSGHYRIVSSIVRKKYITEMDLLRLQKALLMCRMTADSTYLVNKETPAYSSKLEELENLIEQLYREPGRKVILFSEWTTMLDLIEPILNKRKLNFVRLDGSVPQKKRQALVNQFQTDDNCKLFITTNAGSTGLNLQAANTVINVDLPWNPAILEQRISRAHRMGQKQPVQVFILVTEGTLEENLLITLSAKHELALAALDVESDVDYVEMVSGFDELKRRLEILLGTKPEVPIDKSEEAAVAETLHLRKENVAAAGGQLLSAAFGFLQQIMPETAESEQSRQLAQQLKQQLGECLETGENGEIKMTVILPDNAALDSLAEAMAGLLYSRVDACR
ncbi:MAG: DEAD/DEAH box helicase [Pseudomonadales bacterium]